MMSYLGFIMQRYCSTIGDMKSAQQIQDIIDKVDRAGQIIDAEKSLALREYAQLSSDANMTMSDK
jgi:hypothetical protein